MISRRGRVLSTPLCVRLTNQCLSRKGHASVRDASGQTHTGWALHTCDGPPRGSDLSAPVVLRKTHSMSSGSSSYKFLFCPWDGTRCALRARPQASTQWRRGRQTGSESTTRHATHVAANAWRVRCGSHNIGPPRLAGSISTCVFTCAVRRVEQRRRANCRSSRMAEGSMAKERR